MTDRDDDDLEAAELVLGTLDADERAAATSRQRTDPAFAALVAAWESRLAPLSEASREIEPPPDVWTAILRRIGLSGEPVGDAALGPTVVMLHRSVRRWQRATVLVGALAACLAAVVAAGTWRDTVTVTPMPAFVALLQKADAAPAAYVMRADLRDRTLAVHTLDAKTPPGRSYQLWIIAPQLGAPRSLGLLDPATSMHALPPATSPAVLADATYAVTEEQSGGSLTGAPTGTPVFVGHLVSSAF